MLKKTSLINLILKRNNKMMELAKLLISRFNTDMGVIIVCAAALTVAGLALYFAILVLKKVR